MGMTLAINSVLQMFFCLPLLFFFKGHQHFLKILLYLELLVLSIVLFYCIYSYEKDVIFFLRVLGGKSMWGRYRVRLSGNNIAFRRKRFFRGFFSKKMLGLIGLWISLFFFSCSSLGWLVRIFSLFFFFFIFFYFSLTLWYLLII